MRGLGGKRSWLRWRVQVCPRRRHHMDILTKEERSARMALVRAKDTGPEKVVRRIVFALGYRYRLGRRELAGVPDLAFIGRRKAIFVHGCFWHRHPGCRLARMPKTNVDYWKGKLEGNRKRDLRNQRLLRRAGWKFLVVWECETRKPQGLAAKLARFLEAA